MEPELSKIIVMLMPHDGSRFGLPSVDGVVCAGVDANVTRPAPSINTANKDRRSRPWRVDLPLVLLSRFIWFCSPVPLTISWKERTVPVRRLASNQLMLRILGGVCSDTLGPKSHFFGTLDILVPVQQSSWVPGAWQVKGEFGAQPGFPMAPTITTIAVSAIVAARS